MTIKQALLNALEAQGARCGHIDGKRRHGWYVDGEEYSHAHGAALAAIHDRRPACVEAWAQGYAAGYRVGADGQELDPATVSHVLPEAV